MTLIVAVILTNPPVGDRITPVAVILTKVRICVLKTLITILNQVQNDANRGRHSDESAGWRIKLKSKAKELLTFDF